MGSRIPNRLIEERLRAEVGAIPKQAPLRVALAYPVALHGRDELARVPAHLPGDSRSRRA